MKNTTVGVDTSLNSPSPTSTIKQAEAVGLDPSTGIAATHLSTPGNYVALNSAVVIPTHTVNSAVNQVVIPALAKLLAKIISAIEASLPNKDQNRAVKRIVRENFDEAYFRILAGSFPDCQFGSNDSFYALEPEPDKKPSAIL
jgi:hypothetical protein